LNGCAGFISTRIKRKETPPQNFLGVLGLCSTQVAAPPRIGWVSLRVCHVFHNPSTPGNAIRVCSGSKPPVQGCLVPGRYIRSTPVSRSAPALRRLFSAKTSHLHRAYFLEPTMPRRIAPPMPPTIAPNGMNVKNTSIPL
jgi:hypothetical protein